MLVSLAPIGMEPFLRKWQKGPSHCRSRSRGSLLVKGARRPVLLMLLVAFASSLSSFIYVFSQALSRFLFDVY